MTDLLPTTTSVFDQLPDDFDQWAAYGHQLQTADTAVNWAIGDWVLFGETHWPDRAIEATAATGLSQATISRAVTVARRFSPERRRAEVPWSVYRELVALDPADQDRYVAMAADNGLSSRAVRAVIDQEDADRQTAGEARDQSTRRAARGAAPDEPLKPDHVQMPENDNSVRGGRNTEQPRPGPVVTSVQVLTVEVPDDQADAARRSLEQLASPLQDRLAAAGAPDAKVEVR